MSEQLVKVMLFPFINTKQEPLVESILLLDYPLWECIFSQDGNGMGNGRNVLNHTLLVVLIFLCSVYQCSEVQSVKLVYPGKGTPKRVLVPHVMTEMESYHHKYSQEKKKRKEEEKKRMSLEERCKKQAEYILKLENQVSIQ